MKIFTFNKIRVFFKHTDYYGFAHPYNYLEWMSHARESFFQEMVPNFMELCESEIKMVTISVEFKLLSDTKFGDDVTIRIYAEKVKKLSFDIVFEFYNEKSKNNIGKGRQRITFLDGKSGKPAKIPEDLKQPVLIYSDKSADVGKSIN